MPENLSGCVTVQRASVARGAGRLKGPNGAGFAFVVRPPARAVVRRCAWPMESRIVPVAVGAYSFSLEPSKAMRHPDLSCWRISLRFAEDDAGGVVLERVLPFHHSDTVGRYAIQNAVNASGIIRRTGRHWDVGHGAIQNAGLSRRPPSSTVVGRHALAVQKRTPDRVTPCLRSACAVCHPQLASWWVTACQTIRHKRGEWTGRRKARDGGLLARYRRLLTHDDGLQVRKRHFFQLPVKRLQADASGGYKVVRGHLRSGVEPPLAALEHRVLRVRGVEEAHARGWAGDVEVRRPSRAHEERHPRNRTSVMTGCFVALAMCETISRLILAS